MVVRDDVIHMVAVRLLKIILLLLVVGMFLPILACSSPHRYIDVVCSKMGGDTVVDREVAIQCQTFKQAQAATAVHAEASLLVKSYRACLAKYEQTPGRANELCAEYPKAISNVACTKIAGDIVLGPEVAERCENSRQEEAATAVYNEAMLLVRSYRSCLEKYERAPGKSKEYCGEYPRALKAIGLKVKEEPKTPRENTAAVQESAATLR